MRRALELGIEIGRALAFAHAQGLVHRDVKPQNVLLNGDGRAKVTDFGIARSLDVAGMTQTGTVLGTSDYIAPEQARGEPVGGATDVYSLGVVLYELLTGELPFAGDNFVAVAMRHINEPPPRVLDRRPDVPLRLAAIDRALAKEPDDRSASMDDFVAELEACLAELGARDGGEGDGIVRAREPREPRRAAGARGARRRRALPLLLAPRSGCCARGRRGRRRSALGDATATTVAPAAAGGERSRSAASASYDPRRRRRASTTSGSPTRPTATRRPTGRRDVRYARALHEAGVGLVLDAAGDAEQLTRDDRHARLHGRDPGGRLAARPVRAVSGEHGRRHDDDLRSRRARRRYYVVWITELRAAART